MSIITLPTWYYQHFGADFSLPVPTEGFGGWKQAQLELNLEHTALVVMHAWNSGTREEYPGWYSAVPYLARAAEIGRAVFPPLLDAVRLAGVKLYHVVAPDMPYYRDYPGYRAASALAGPPPAPPPTVQPDPVYDRLRAFKSDHVFQGRQNAADIQRGFEHLDFMDQARPLGDEGVAESSEQLFGLCRRDGVNHLIYIGFTVEGCILSSPGGMFEMSRLGLLCSVIREATTSIENKETAAAEGMKALGLWRTALYFGFVYDLEDFLAGLRISKKDSDAE